MIHAMTKSMNARERSEREVEIGNASGGGVGGSSSELVNYAFSPSCWACSGPMNQHIHIK